MADISPTELPQPAESPAAGGAPQAQGPGAPDPQRLAEQVADRVYRLMVAETRLSLARGQPAPYGPRRAGVRR